MGHLWALAAALLSLAVGLGLLIWTQKKPTTVSGSISHISWLLIAMTPVLVLFTVFPESEISVGFKTVSATGAVAFFVFIWYRGTRLTSNSANQALPELRIRLTEANQELNAIRQRERNRTPIRNHSRYIYRVKQHPDRVIGIATGDLRNVEGFDIWVNSENTNMRMAGIYERSISATIRYLGSEVDEFGDPVQDTVNEELRIRMDGRSSVDPHTVLVTNAGRLAETKRVMRIFHVAASVRERTSGSHPIPH